MCIGENLVGTLIKNYRNLFYKVKVDYRELSDEEQWEEITKSFKI